MISKGSFFPFWFCFAFNSTKMHVHVDYALRSFFISRENLIHSMKMIRGWLPFSSDPIQTNAGFILFDIVYISFAVILWKWYSLRRKRLLLNALHLREEKSLPVTVVKVILTFKVANEHANEIEVINCCSSTFGFGLILLLPLFSSLCYIDCRCYIPLLTT